MIRLSLWGVLGVLALSVRAIPVDNGVEGDPEIDCGPTSITVNFNTQQPFEGHVYVKGLYATQGCRNDDTGRQVAGITMPFNTCGISRQRSLNPLGVFVSTTIIVDTGLDASMLTTGFQSQVVPMPVCRYEILDGSPAGPIIEHTLVGQQVYHKWTCDTETIDTFCMVVHSCFVDDNNDDRVDLIGPDGCAIDIYLLNNPEYPTDLMAGVEAHVFKYADRPQLYFQCQVTIFVKEPNGECPRPNCAAPPGRGGPRPAGPQPPPPPNPFPLGPGSPYLPEPGQENPFHGPGDPAAPFAAHPGRPNPATFHLPGARVDIGSGPAAPRQPRPGGPRQPFQPRTQPAPRRQPAAPRPFQARPGARGQQFNPRGQRQPGRFVDPRQPFGGRRTFNDAPALDETETESRKRRQVEYYESAPAGTVDVRTAISALDIEDSAKFSDSLSKQFSIPDVIRQSTISKSKAEPLCFSAANFIVAITLSTLLLIMIVSFTLFLLVKRSKNM